MPTYSSDLLRLTVTHGGAGKEAFAHLSRDDSQAMIQAEMLQLSVKIRRRAALLEASSIDSAQSSEDRAAIAWIQRSLEDVEATIIGLSEADRDVPWTGSCGTKPGTASSEAGNPKPVQ